jgi:hypothetical protein
MDAVMCAPGSYNIIPGSSSSADCVECPPGFYCPNDLSATDKILPCDAGYFCTLSAADAEGNGECPIGTYCPEGSAYPLYCKRGHYCDVEGLTDTVADTMLCSAGYFCYSKTTTATPTDGTTGWKCPAGHYCPEQTLTPIACDAGTYKSTTGGTGVKADDCTPCTEGMYCPLRGMSNPTTACPAGYFFNDLRNIFLDTSVLKELMMPISMLALLDINALQEALMKLFVQA